MTDYKKLLTETPPPREALIVALIDKKEFQTIQN